MGSSAQLGMSAASAGQSAFSSADQPDLRPGLARVLEFTALLGASVPLVAEVAPGSAEIPVRSCGRC